MSEIYIGVGASPVSDYYLFLIPPSTTTTFLNHTAPALYTGTLTTFQICVDSSPTSTTTAIFNTYSIDGGTPYVITKQNSSGTLTIPAGITEPTVLTLDSQSVSVTAGYYLGVSITNNSSGNLWISMYGVEPNCSTMWEFQVSGNPSSCNYPGSGSYNPCYWMAYGGIGTQTGGDIPPDACQESAQFTTQSGYLGWGWLAVQGADCSVPPYQVWVDLRTPWNEYMYDEVFYDDITRSFLKTQFGPNEYWSIRFNLISCLGYGFFQITECWWRESDIYYVKNGGSDSKMGTNWTEAFATISKAATVVPQGGKVYIGHGTYNSETNIVPTTLGSTPIYYKPVIAGTSGGTGSVVINL